jgi:hypothetical protein
MSDASSARRGFVRDVRTTYSTSSESRLRASYAIRKQGN